MKDVWTHVQFEPLRAHYISSRLVLYIYLAAHARAKLYSLAVVFAQVEQAVRVPAGQVW